MRKIITKTVDKKNKLKTIKKITKTASNLKRVNKSAVTSSVKSDKTVNLKSKSGIVPIIDISGKNQGLYKLPKNYFLQKPNNKLLAQAHRIFYLNQFIHKASTKTRSQVRGGGAKPWSQKGRGRARAGSIRSPLWVGGGVVFGPKPRKSYLKLPKKMRKIAFISALSAKNEQLSIKIVSDIDKIKPKTKILNALLKKLDISGNTLLILDKPRKNVELAARNIPKIFVQTLDNLNTLNILESENLLFSKEAINKLNEKD